MKLKNLMMRAKCGVLCALVAAALPITVLGRVNDED